MKNKNVAIIMPAQNDFKNHPYVQNMKNIVSGYFTVYEQLLLLLYLRLQTNGYTIPPFGKKNSRVRPHKSIGPSFYEYLHRKYNPVNVDLLEVPFFDSGGEVENLNKDNMQYAIRYLPDFYAFYSDVWLPQYAHRYFNGVNPNVMPYLQNVLPSREQVNQRVEERRAAEKAANQIEVVNPAQPVQPFQTRKEWLEALRKERSGH